MAHHRLGLGAFGERCHFLGEVVACPRNICPKKDRPHWLMVARSEATGEAYLLLFRARTPAKAHDRLVMRLPAVEVQVDAFHNVILRFPRGALESLVRGVETKELSSAVSFTMYVTTLKGEDLRVRAAQLKQLLIRNGAVDGGGAGNINGGDLDHAVSECNSAIERIFAEVAARRARSVGAAFASVPPTISTAARSTASSAPPTPFEDCLRELLECEVNNLACLRVLRPDYFDGLRTVCAIMGTPLADALEAVHEAFVDSLSLMIFADEGLVTLRDGLVAIQSHSSLETIVLQAVSVCEAVADVMFPAYGVHCEQCMPRFEAMQELRKRHARFNDVLSAIESYDHLKQFNFNTVFMKPAQWACKVEFLVSKLKEHAGKMDDGLVGPTTLRKLDALHARVKGEADRINARAAGTSMIIVDKELEYPRFLNNDARFCETKIDCTVMGLAAGASASAAASAAAGGGGVGGALPGKPGRMYVFTDFVGVAAKKTSTAVADAQASFSLTEVYAFSESSKPATHALVHARAVTTDDGWEELELTLKSLMGPDAGARASLVRMRFKCIDAGGAANAIEAARVRWVQGEGGRVGPSLVLPKPVTRASSVMRAVRALSPSRRQARSNTPQRMGASAALTETPSLVSAAAAGGAGGGGGLGNGGASTTASMSSASSWIPNSTRSIRSGTPPPGRTTPLRQPMSAADAGSSRYLGASTSSSLSSGVATTPLAYGSLAMPAMTAPMSASHAKPMVFSSSTSTATTTGGVGGPLRGALVHQQSSTSSSSGAGTGTGTGTGSVLRHHASSNASDSENVESNVMASVTSAMGGLSFASSRPTPIKMDFSASAAAAAAAAAPRSAPSSAFPLGGGDTSPGFGPRLTAMRPVGSGR